MVIEGRMVMSSERLLSWRGRFLTVTASLAMAGLLIAFADREAPAQQGKKTAEKKDETPKKAETVKVPTYVPDIMVNTAGGLEQVTYINEMIAKMWADNKIRPAERCTDYEFIRRASLDIIGRIATVPEITIFLRDPPRERRSRLIERLLGSEDGKLAKELEGKEYIQEYAANWANTWTVALLTRSTSSKDAKDQMESWFEEKLTEKNDSKGKLIYTPDWSQIVTELLTATGKQNENGAVNYILHHMGEPIPGPDQAASGRFDFVPVTSRTTKLFLGLRTQCVQCHDHPFSGDWGQHHFWGVNAFFRQVEPSGRPGMMQKKKVKGALEQRLELRDNTGLNKDGLVHYERRNGLLAYTDATFLDGKKPPKGQSAAPRRAELAKFITTSPFFAKAYVNRAWAHFFGRSFTRDAPDDFGEHNPASNQELLDRLADDWGNKYKHDPKAIIRWLCNSRPYGLSSVANSTNDKLEDEVFFARMLLKSMGPEQLFESLMISTMAKVGQTKESRQALREQWLNRLVVNFGDDEGNELNFNGTVVQALMLMNGQDINSAIMDRENGTVAHVIKVYGGMGNNGLKPAMTYLFLSGLNRPPNAKETESILGGSARARAIRTLPKVPAPKTASEQLAFWTGFYQDMFWAILNSNEFILNH